MESVKAAIEKRIAGDGTSATDQVPLKDGMVDFMTLGSRWAEHSLRTYTDGLLGKALDISKALAEFDHELRNE